MAVEGSILGFDFGTRRVGVALSDTISRVAKPLEVLSAETREARWQGVERVIREWEPVAVIVGVPCHPDGTPHEMTTQAKRFARQLQGRFQKPVYVVDERYSSAVVEDALGKAKGVHIDDMAASVILQQWFDEGMPERVP